MPIQTTTGARLAGAALLLILTSAGWAQSSPRAPHDAPAAPATAPAGPEQPVITHHSGTFNGREVEYDAIVEPIVVANSAGEPSARLVAITYLATTASARTQRPVLFVFNGGPISPSCVLHMGALGPKRVAIPDDLTADPDKFQTVDNPYTVLDVADLVFFDPASTGFSRVLPGVDPASYFSVDADGQQLAQFVLEWSRKHGRLDSPKYLFGESYGTMRAAATASQLQKLSPPLPLSGVVLMGQALNIIEFSQRPANVTSYVVSLPTLAAIAWSHGKAQTHGESFDQFMRAVELFARTEYLTALFQGSSLDHPTAKKIATRLEQYTGIPASWYLANELRITKERYRRELFKDRSEVLGITDARYVGPATDSGGYDPAEVTYRAYNAAFPGYLHGELGVGDVGEYVTKDPVRGLEGWQWNGTGTSPFADWPYLSLLSEVFAANPRFRVMIANGWQDTQTTVGAAQLALDQSGWPRDRTSLHFYQGGHMAYSIESSLRALDEDVRRFMTAAPEAVSHMAAPSERQPK
jgi:carboxypeptidase C (cathepsin A)